MYLNHIYQHARTNPKRLALVNSGEEITYARFAGTIEAVRNHLLRAGLPRDGIIAKITSNLYHDWVLMLATRSLGLTTVSGTSWQSIEGLGLRNITGLVCLSSEEAKTAAFRDARPECKIAVVPLSLLAIPNDTSAPLPLPDGKFGDHIVYTSGTTGTYKMLLLDGSNLDRQFDENCHGLTARYLTKDDIYFGYNFGPWTATGYRSPLRAWRRGAVVILDQRPDWIEHFHDHVVTMTFFVPGSLADMHRVVSTRPADYPPLKIQTGGGFLDADMAMEMIEQFGCEIYHAYGGTEFRTALMNNVKSREDIVWLTPTFEPGIEVVDEDDMEVPLGVEGNLRIELTPSAAKGYLDDPEATARHYRDGYFYPGDMAVKREDGRIRILGRVDDVINLLGQKIAIEPFEDAVRKTLGIESLCVFVKQDENGKDMLVVAIEGAEHAELEKREVLAGRLPQVPTIRYVLIERFPRGENGMMKVNRRRLLELLRASRDD